MPVDVNPKAPVSAASAPRIAALLIGAFALLHLAVAGQLGLSVDEAHYALYGARPDLSYFDHPPMVGWLQALALLLGDGERTLRLWPILLSAATAALLYRFTRELFPEEGPGTALMAVVGYESAAMFQLLGLALVPEGPFLLFALAAALFLHRAVEEGRGRDWLLMGLMFGLAGLSKYTAVTLVLTAAAYVALRGRWRLLATPWPWLAVLLAAVVIAPVLIWNLQHDFISFTYQLQHGAPKREWSLTRFLTGQGYQLGAYGPGVYLLGWGALAAALPRWREPGSALCLALALPVLLLLGWGAGREEGLPHWSALGWLAALPLAARWVRAGRSTPVMRWLLRGSAAWAVVVLAALHALLIHPWIPVPSGPHPMGDLLGWREAAQAAVALRARAAPEAQLFVGNWTHASRIAWYARPLPVQVADDRFDQFDLWYGTPRPGATGVLVVPDAAARRPGSGLDRFGTCEEKETLPVTPHGVTVHTFHLYVCSGYRG